MKIKQTKQNPNRQIMIVDFISTYLQKNKRCPTMREITKGVGLKSLGGVWEHLERMGFTTGDRNWWKNNKKETTNKMCCPMCKRSFDDKVQVPIIGEVVKDKKLGNKIVWKKKRIKI